MGIFDIFDDMKEKSDKRRRAEEYRRRAREYVKDGERIYNEAYSQVTSYSYETSCKIENHYNYKQRIIKEISSDVSPVLSRFNSFDIDHKVFDAPSVNDSLLSSLSGKDLFSGVSSFASTLSIPSILDLFSDPEEEYWEARRQKDEAKRFYEDVKYEREKLRNIKEKMRIIRSYIDDEKQLLDSLVSKVNNITSQLRLGMTKTSFTQSEADYLKGVHRIAQNMSELLTTRFLDNNFTITSQYQLSFDRLKQINSSIEVAPSVTEGTEGIRKLLDILGTTTRN
ncbi:MAG: hypothetical protein K0R80_2413 [Clostridia bacterium]|jgi:hypothetical protein|nr:hypothetical protein [Clostridia bacterium]